MDLRQLLGLDVSLEVVIVDDNAAGTSTRKRKSLKTARTETTRNRWVSSPYDKALYSNERALPGSYLKKSKNFVPKPPTRKASFEFDRMTLTNTLAKSLLDVAPPSHSRTSSSSRGRDVPPSMSLRQPVRRPSLDLDAEISAALTCSLELDLDLSTPTPEKRKLGGASPTRSPPRSPPTRFESARSA